LKFETGVDGTENGFLLN